MNNIMLFLIAILNFIIGTGRFCIYQRADNMKYSRIKNIYYNVYILIIIY